MEEQKNTRVSYSQNTNNVAHRTHIEYDTYLHTDTVTKGVFAWSMQSGSITHWVQSTSGSRLKVDWKQIETLACGCTPSRVDKRHLAD